MSTLHLPISLLILCMAFTVIFFETEIRLCHSLLRLKYNLKIGPYSLCDLHSYLTPLSSFCLTFQLQQYWPPWCSVTISGTLLPFHLLCSPDIHRGHLLPPSGLTHILPFYHTLATMSKNAASPSTLPISLLWFIHVSIYYHLYLCILFLLIVCYSTLAYKVYEGQAFYFVFVYCSIPSTWMGSALSNCSINTCWMNK